MNADILHAPTWNKSSENSPFAADVRLQGNSSKGWFIKQRVVVVEQMSEFSKDWYST